MSFCKGIALIKASLARLVTAEKLRLRFRRMFNLYVQLRSNNGRNTFSSICRGYLTPVRSNITKVLPQGDMIPLAGAVNAAHQLSPVYEKMENISGAIWLRSHRGSYIYTKRVSL